MIVAAILESWSATMPPMYSVGDGHFGIFFLLIMDEFSKFKLQIKAYEFV